jgi:DUF177 domain-containing protein
MLLIHVSKIPPEGLSIDAPLSPGEVHLDGDEGFTLRGGALRCHVERGDDNNVHVRGQLQVEVALSCGRCLEAFTLAMQQELDLFYLPHEADQEQEEEDEVELSDRDVVVAYYQGDRLDLGDMIREQLYLSVPATRLCREDCRGLCPHCGVNRNQQDCTCPTEEPTVSPFASLRRKIDGSEP